MNQAWYPSAYGKDDQIGMLNEVTPEKTAEAAKLVKSGKTYDLSHVLDEHVPAFPGRSFHQYLTSNAHAVNRRQPDSGPLGGWGENDMNWIVEVVTSTSQLGTHLDGLNHIQIGDRCYNGHRLVDIAEEYGTNRLGIETVPQIVTRGLLVDVAGHRNTQSLNVGEVIQVEEVEEILSSQNLAVRPGDALLFHTGWSRYWMSDNETYLSGEPGPGLKLAHWLAEQRVAVTGCDTWSFGPVPAETHSRPFVVPQTLNAHFGVFVVENLATAALARDQAYEFMLVISHAKLKGATGAWVAPVAIC